VLGGKIHAVGGIGWRGRNTPAHEVYDPAANRWTALAYVPTARDHLAAAVIDGRLYAVGGPHRELIQGFWSLPRLLCTTDLGNAVMFCPTK
jgi:hypothetical protein